MRLGWCFGVALCCLAACAGSNDDEDDDDSIAREDMPAAYASGMCEALSVCCESLGQPMSVADCREFIEPNIANQNDPALSYDGQAAAACLAAGTSAYRQCSTPSASVCERVWAGSLENGAACESNRDCQSRFCDSALCQTPEALPALGEPCTLECAEGAHCDQTTLRCRALEPEGAPCVASSECAGGYCEAGVCDESSVFLTLCTTFAGAPAPVSDPHCCALDELCARCGCADAGYALIAASDDGEDCRTVLEQDEVGCSLVSEDDALAACQ
jgi:hypothetical protein